MPGLIPRPSHLSWAARRPTLHSASMAAGCLKPLALRHFRLDPLRDLRAEEFLMLARSIPLDVAVDNDEADSLDYSGRPRSLSRLASSPAPFREYRSSSLGSSSVSTVTSPVAS